MLLSKSHATISKSFGLGYPGIYSICFTYPGIYSLTYPGIYSFTYLGIYSLTYPGIYSLTYPGIHSQGVKRTVGVNRTRKDQDVNGTGRC